MNETKLILLSCIEGHSVYAEESELHEAVFCKEPSYHNGLLTWCGLPIYQVPDPPEED